MIFQYIDSQHNRLFGNVPHPNKEGIMGNKPTYEELEKRLERNEVQLKIANDKLLVAQKYAKLGWWEFDIHADKITWSDEIYEMFGITHDEDPLKFERMMKLIPPEFHDYHNKQVKLLLDTGSAEFEYPINRPDGKICWIYTKGNLRIDNNGKPTHMFGVTQNITERKRNEIALKESEERYRSLFEDADVLISIYDRNGLCQIMNKKVANLFGGDPEKYIGKTLPELHPDKGKDYANRLREVIDKGTSKDYEDEVVFPKGIRWLLSKVHPIYNAQEEIVAAQIISHNITERKKSEEALRESKERFDLAMNATKDGIFDWNLITNEIYYSPGWKLMLGYQYDELPNKFSVWENLTDPEDVKRSWKMQQELIKKRRDRFEIEFKMRHKNGHWVYILSRAKAIFNDKGQAIRMIGTHVDITDKKKSEETWHLAQTMAKIGSWSFDIASQQPTWSKQMFEVLGCDPAKGVPSYKAHEKLFHPDDWEMFDQAVQASINGKPYNLEIRIIFPDGSLHWCNTQGYPRFDHNGKVIELFGTSQDITERKQAEEALKESEEKYRLAMEATSDGLWDWNIKTGDVFYSQSWSEILSEDSVKQEFQTWESRLHPDDKPDTLSSFQLHLDGKVPFWRKEHRLQTKNGSWKWVLGRGRVVERDSAGRPKRMIGTMTDISERKQAEMELKKSQERLQLALESADEGMWEWDLKTNQVTFDKGAMDMLGYTVDDFNAHEDFALDLIHPDEKDEILNIANAYISGKIKSYDVEFRLRHKGGNYKWVWSVGKITMWDKNGKPMFFTGVHRDISERKIMEAQTLKVEKLEAVGTLAGGIAHDFNNMLGIILGNVSYLLHLYNDNEELVEVLTDIQEGSKKAQKLTQQLLTFAKGGAPVKKATDLKSLIEESAKFVTRGAKVKCKFSLSDALWTAEVDSGQLNQVITNLVINANQAMPDGGIITLSARNTILEEGNKYYLSAGKYIEIIIEDQGVGISEKQLPKIFDPYFSTKQNGSGLGLSTAFSIIKKHDGHIIVESKIDEGTTFYIYLPVSGEQFLKAITKDSIKHSGKGKILVMDDEEHILKIAGRILTKMGYAPHFAKNGNQAIDMYASAYKSGTLFDAVILDLTIPGEMGGQLAIKGLLQIDPKVKAIVSSGYSNDPVMADYKDYGFLGVMPKPYSQDEVANVLNEVFNKGA